MYRIALIVAGCVLALASGLTRPGGAQTAAPPDTTRVPSDSAGVIIPDTTHAITVIDSLGIPGTLRGQTVDPDSTKKVLQKMGSHEVEGRTQWERQKNPKVAMLCHTLLPGLGQTYNGRRLKVGLMVGFASYYYGNAYLNLKHWKASEAQRDQFAPGTPEYATRDALADFYKEEARTYLWWSGAVWLIGLIDSWIDAHLYDVRSYTPPKIEETPTPRASNEQINYMTIGFTLERAKK